MTKVYLHMGTNIGDRAANLATARHLISTQIGSIVKTSSLYETEAWGLKNQPDFYNQALEVETDLLPNQLLDESKRIEQSMGRQTAVRWGRRLIDIDILFYGTEIINSDRLKIPHREMTNRNFVLIPMLEIQAELEHPLLKKTIEELYWESQDTLEVVLLNEEIKH